VARAVATSSALPPMLTPISLRNRAGSCGWHETAWAAGVASGAPLGRSGLSALELRSYAYANAADRPYVHLHLFDGGRREPRAADAHRGARRHCGGAAFARAGDREGSRQLLAIVVNAHKNPARDWDRDGAAS